MSNFLKSKTLFALVLACAAAGCSTARLATLPPAPYSAPATDAQLAYKLGVGDELEFLVWRHPDLTTKAVVGPDGRGSMPLVESVSAAGLTSDQLGRTLETHLSRMIRDPVVTVMVRTSHSMQGNLVQVAGEISKPISMPYRKGMRVLDLIIQGGGLTPPSDGNGAILARTVNGVETRYRLRLKDLLYHGKSDANVELLPGDSVFVPTSVF